MQYLDKKATTISVLGILVGLLLLFNTQYLLGFNRLPIFWLYTFGFLCFYPGYIILSIFKIKKLPIWESVMYCLGLSIIALLSLGLTLNTLLPLFHFTQALGFIPSIIALDVLLGGLLLFNLKSFPRLKFVIKPKKLNYHSLFIIVASALIILLSVIGPFFLNNGGSNIFSMFSLGLIVVMMFVFLLTQNKKTENSSPLFLVSVGIALLLIYCLRSNYLFGWDIHEEYRFFSLTNIAKKWTISDLHRPFEACLSVTILPTILSTFLPYVKPEYIFKLYMQFVFGFSPLGLYLIARRYLQTFPALLSAFILLAQIWYTQLMPALVRQEIALLFFILSILVILNNTIDRLAKYLLFILFLVGIVVSHYSTSYVYAGILLVYQLLHFLVNKFFFTYKPFKQLIDSKIIILFVIMIFIWNSLLTQTSKTFVDFSVNVVSNMKNSFSYDVLQEGFSRVLFQDVNINTPANLEKYSEEAKNLINYYYPDMVRYDPEKYHQYQLLPASYEKIPIRNHSVWSIMTKLLTVNRIIITDILPIMGVVLIFIKLLKEKTVKHAPEFDFVILAVSTIPLVASIVFLPIIKVGYNIERLHLQALILLAFPTVYAGQKILSFIRKPLIILTVMFCFMFFGTTGFIYQIIGGKAVEHLNNFGEGYDKYYEMDTELFAAKWLETNKLTSAPVFADQTANLRLLSGTAIDTRIVHTDLLPSTISRDAYVYLSHSNYIGGKAFHSFNTGMLVYAYPIDFLNKYKDLIYSNKNSIIYK